METQPQPSATTATQPEAATTLAAGRVTALLELLARAPDAASEAPLALAPGDRLGRFELQREIGRGGFGVVFEARDGVLGRTVALKILRRARRDEEGSSRGLVEEAEAAARLQHPNIVSVFDVGAHDGVAYIVLELLRGETLAARLHRGRLEPARALHVAREVARALAHAHGRGVVHRDLKPGNVFLCEDGGVKVLDFGLSRFIGGAATTSGGTPGYMAPEQARGEEEDARADVYALGVVLKEMLDGVRPSPDGRGGASQTSANPGGDRKSTSPAPRGLAPLLARMLAENAAQRPRDGAEVAEGLGAAIRRVERRAGKRLALVLCALLAAGAAAWAGSRPVRGPAPPAPGADGRVGVVVADAKNATGQDSLGAVAAMIATSLEQSPRLRVPSRARVLELAESSEGAPVRIDVAAAAVAARVNGASVLVVPGIARSARGYALSIAAQHPGTGAELYTVRAEGADVSLLVDRVVEGLRLWLGETREEVSAASIRAGQAITRSAEAYALYVQADDVPWRRGDVAVQRALLERALELDPDMAMARYELALLEIGRGTVPHARVRELLAQAVRNAGALPEKERLLVRALDARMRLDIDGALALYRTAIQRFPDETRTRLLAAEMLWLDGGYRPEALPLVDEVLAMDPTLQGGWELLYRVLCSAGRCDEALARAQEAAAARPGYGTLRPLFAVHLFRGDRAALYDVAERVLTIGDGVPWQTHYPMATAFYLDDQYERANEVIASVPDIPVPVVAFMRVAQGKWREARRLLASDERHAGYQVPASRGRDVLLLAGIGPATHHREAALELCAELEDQCNLAVVSALLAGDVELARECLRASPSPNAEVYRPFIEAWELVKAGRGAAAVSRARAIARPDVVQRQLAALLTADLCFAAGEWRCAVDGYREYRAAGFTAPAPFKDAHHAWAYPRSLLRRAIAHEQLGERAEALEATSALLRLWKDADPELPILQQAQRVQARVGRTPVRAGAPAAR